MIRLRFAIIALLISNFNKPNVDFVNAKIIFKTFHQYHKIVFQVLQEKTKVLTYQFFSAKESN